LQNRHLFHLCPSEVEGFGHYLAEAMSVGAVVITTNGAPMNELVQPERGLLVAPVSRRSENLATRYGVDAAGIEQAVAQALAMSDAQRVRTGEAARRFFLEMGAGFQQRLIQVVDAKLSAGRGPATPFPY
jgi:glycosyltransferase involved in cell wall biosynthesis